LADHVGAEPRKDEWAEENPVAAIPGQTAMLTGKIVSGELLELLAQRGVGIGR
jgi:hypothetical protein